MSSNYASIGMQLAQSGRIAEALPYLERAHAIDPVDADLLHATASLLQAVGRTADAVRCYQTSARLMPGDTTVLVGWGRALLIAQDESAALAPLNQALEIDPQIAAETGVLRLLWSAEQKDLAVRMLRSLVASHPENIDLLCQFAQILRMAEHLDEAEAVWRHYMTLRPDDPMGPVSAGDLAVSRGDTEAARRLFDQALAMAPDDPRALGEFALLVRGEFDSDVRQRLQAAIARGAEPDTMAMLHDVLARYHDRIGEHAAADAHVQSMNAAQDGGIALADRYDVSLHGDEIAFAIETYVPGLFARLAGAGSGDRRPVFVIGLPRSGTTLLERLLAAHPQIVGVGEQSFVRQGLLRALALGDGLPGSLSPTAVNVSAQWHLEQLEDRVRRLGVPGESQRIVDKLPDNYLLAGWIRIVFPDAIIVHSLRDPRDVAWSCWSTHFAKINWSLRLEHIAHRIEQHRALMRHWRSVLGDRLVEVRYERLVAAPETELRRVLTAMGMTWSDQVMDFSRHKGFVGSASRHQVREGINARSIGRWHAHAAALQPVLARLEAVVAQDAREATPELRL